MATVRVFTFTWTDLQVGMSVSGTLWTLISQTDSYIYLRRLFPFFSLEVTAWRKMKKPEPTTRVGLAPDIAWGVGVIQRDGGSRWDRKQYSSLPHSTPDNTALAARKRHPLGWVSDQKITRQICWKEDCLQTTVEFQRHISNNTCPLCVTVHKTHL